MKTNLKKASMLLTGLLVSGSLFAQTDSVDTKNYVKPFSGGPFRTWSIGVHGGLLTPIHNFWCQWQTRF
jgi:OOP family OmpA-OmpF porin